MTLTTAVEGTGTTPAEERVVTTKRAPEVLQGAQCKCETFSRISHPGLTLVISMPADEFAGYGQINLRNLYLMKRRLDSRFSETQPILIKAIQKRRDIVLGAHGLGRAMQAEKPVVNS